MTQPPNSDPDTIIFQEKLRKPNGDELLKNYKRGRILGKGGFASVYECTCLETSQTLACKIISKTSLQKPRIRQKLMFEIKIHRAVHHSHIVSFERFFEDEYNIYILLELCQNQTMSELLRRRKRLTEIEIQCYLAQIVSALKYLHSHQIIHRDIKLGNLFLNNKMEIKLGDFGLATKLEFEGERKRTICGTPNYIAPEILEGKEGHSFEVDLWSLGILLYSLATGQAPFETDSIKLTYRRIKLGQFVFPNNMFVSDELKDLISSLLVVDPFMRPSLDDVLQHDFMKKNLIPKYLPTSTLACPPTGAYLMQFLSNSKGPKEIRASSLSRFSDELRSTASKDEEKSNEKIETLQVVLNEQNNASKKTTVISAFTCLEGAAKIAVKKWVDYSSKYGLGYLMSNNCVGIYFNDTSKVLSDSYGNCIHVYKPEAQNDEITERFKINEFPASLKKKITLLEHFRKHLGSDKGTTHGPLVYVKSWKQTEHATVIRLSDKTMQIRFLDKTELVLSSELKTIAFFDKGGRGEVHPLKAAIQSENRELSKRMNYTTDIISKMANPKSGN